jgi:hypothetical protein
MAGTSPAHERCVTHRIEVSTQDRLVVFEVHGLVDEAALASLDASIAFARQSGAAARVVLRAGTEVERSCLPGLRALDAEIDTDSPFLAAWLKTP